MRRPSLENQSLAEFVGVMLGDGSLVHYECSDGSGGIKDQFVVKVTISKDEKGYSDHVSSLFSEIFNIDPVKYPKSGENTLDIRCFRKELFSFLNQQVGLRMAPKKNRAIIPSR